MNKNLLFLPLISCALLVSCTEEGANDPNNTSAFPKEAQGKTVTFKAAPVSIETKSVSTKVNIKPNDDSDILEWAQSGDAVSVLFDAGVSKEYYTDFTVVPVSGGFELAGGQVPETEGNYKVYAISPAGNYFVGNNADESVLTIPRVQTQTQNSGSYSHLKDFLFLYGGTSQNIAVDSEGNSVGDYELNFTPKVSLLRFDITNKSDKTVKLNHIKISFEGGVGLHKTATLTEKTGGLAVSIFDSHADMTLQLPQPTLSSSITTPYSAYMAVFNTSVSDKLLIDLNVTVDGDTEDIRFELESVTFNIGEKTHIVLDIAEDYFDHTPQQPVFELTWNRVIQSSIIRASSGDNIFVSYNDLSSACPTSWLPLNIDNLRRYNLSLGNIAIDYSHAPITGHWDISSNRIVDFNYMWIYSSSTQAYKYRLAPSSATQPGINEINLGYYRPLCFRMLP